MKYPWILAVLLAALSLSFISDTPRKIHIYLVGDSTMADKEVKNFPETGWGMPFKDYFDSSVVIDNCAKNGRSTSSFIAEGRWNAILRVLRPGDYVFVQFGHNDEVPTKRTYTPPAEYKALLAKYVQDSRARGAYPVLISPVTRRRFDREGHVVETHPLYTPLVREVAESLKVPYINLDSLSRVMVQSYGVHGSTLLYNQVVPGENPHYPLGWIDNTHFSETGARKIAELVLQGMQRDHLPLASHILFVHRKAKKG